MARKKLDLNERDYEIIKNLVALGKTESDIARIYDVSPATLSENKKKDDKLREIVETGLALQLSEVVGALYRKAVGFTQEIKHKDAGGNTTKVEVKYFAPDTLAAMTILNNRAPDLWKQKREDKEVDKKIVFNVTLDGQQYKELKAAEEKKAAEIECDYEVED